jgi:hypothetical protein
MCISMKGKREEKKRKRKEKEWNLAEQIHTRSAPCRVWFAGPNMS